MTQQNLPLAALDIGRNQKCTRIDEEKLLKVIIVAKQHPLTLGELDVALEIELNSTFPTSYADLDLEGDEKRKKWVRKSCGLFVSIIDSRVYLIHQTAKEFLVRHKDDIFEPQGWKHSIDLENAHQTLSKICIMHLHFQDFQDYRMPTNRRRSYYKHRAPAYVEKYSFLDYSASHWIDHVQEAHMDRSIWVSKAAELCDVGDGSSSIWSCIYSTSIYHPYIPSGPSTKTIRTALVSGI
ncbi:hypothetical protein K469DRAFT_692828 [Zopfia rhizophila CBS 207.26]|uniref:GPI inositol-deacylase winged helix domain-containing protein n=1 Tax=Zopfia rhizophila CBS 207.26 TaxID=1314779 RepID=A0A6A6DM85_9PEZI|nr:hypothetical protein K469DRAFT_692828 [Zopfia rhizophila CBS 207.26]